MKVTLKFFFFEFGSMQHVCFKRAALLPYNNIIVSWLKLIVWLGCCAS